MDQRKQELKRLKKASGRARRKKTALWKTLALISLMAGLLYAGASLFETAVFAPAVRQWCQETLGITLGTLQPQLIQMFWLLSGLFGLLFLGLLIPWCRGNRRWKRSREYLDYQTLKRTLQAEKKVLC